MWHISLICYLSGLRFLRLLYLLQLPEVLQMMHILKSSSRIRLVQIVSIFISVWFASSGFVHLVRPCTIFMFFHFITWFLWLCMGRLGRAAPFQRKIQQLLLEQSPVPSRTIPLDLRIRAWCLHDLVWSSACKIATSRVQTKRLYFSIRRRSFRS